MIPVAPLRPASEVMRLTRMAASFPTRLSFLRVLLRRLSAERAQLIRRHWQMDDNGHGEAVYSIELGGRTYSLVALSRPLSDEQRSDRVIATAWDTAYVLYDGLPSAAERARLRHQVPLQEAGRFTARDLVLSRANKSVRLFDYVTRCLRDGRHPDPAELAKVGYLMRTTAVYGNGKFGIADRALYADRPGLRGPFAAEMLTVWMIRCFTHDLVAHLGGAPLAADLRRMLGIGNATGLGMAPFLVAHPVLLHNWMMARETALARVRAQPTVPIEQRQQLADLATRASAHLADWPLPPSSDLWPRLTQLRTDWQRVMAAIPTLPDAHPIESLLQHSAALSLDAQELTVALVIEPFGALVDDLAAEMADNSGLNAAPFDDIPALRAAIEACFGWALTVDFNDPAQVRRFWYTSEEKLEPRLGDRLTDTGAEREAPLDIARQVQALYRALPKHGQSPDLEGFRAAHPEFELAIDRVQGALHHPYSEIRDNLLDARCAPVDMLRCKLAFFGATRFDPRSDLWTRVALAQGAALPEDLAAGQPDDSWMQPNPFDPSAATCAAACAAAATGNVPLVAQNTAPLPAPAEAAPTVEQETPPFSGPELGAATGASTGTEAGSGTDRTT